MDQQAAVLTLTGITYVGSPQPLQFNIQLTSFSDTTILQRSLTPNVLSSANEMVTAQTAPPNQDFSMQVSANVFTAGGGQIHGQKTQTLTAQQNAGSQLFQINVPLTSSSGPSSVMQLRFEVSFRAVPYCWPYTDCLCNRHYYLPIYYNWLCAARDYPSFSALTPVSNIDALMVSKTSVFQSVTADLGLTYPIHTDFFSRLGSGLDVITAATDKSDQLTLRRVLQVSDIYDAFESYMVDYVAAVALNPSIVPYNTPICRKWRELLDCYCRICANWSILPVSVQNDFTTQATPAVDGLYQKVIAACPAESLPYCYYDPNLASQCAKLRNIVSFFSYWCRRCYYEQPNSLPTFEPYFQVLSPLLLSLQAQIDAAQLTICNPPLKDFCPRWKSLLDCLKKLCTNKAFLSQNTLNDVVSTFNAVLRDVYSHMFGAPSTYTNDIGGICSVVSDVSAYYDRYICFSNAVPGGILRRQYFENQLLTLESLLSAFKTRNTDLCASSVPMTNCTDWLQILDCLDNLCAQKEEFTDQLAGSFLSTFAASIDSAYWAERGESAGAASGSIATLCSRLAEVSAFIRSHCPGGVDPIILLRLNSALTALRSAWTTFTGLYTGICSTSVSLPPGYCDNWYGVLKCLQRICASRFTLHQNVLGAFLDKFAGLVSYFHWLILRPTSTYSGPGSYTAASICEKLAVIIAYLDSICPAGSISPVRKLQLDAALAQWQSGYEALLAIYPTICVPATEDFCEEWVGMLDCLTRLCDRRASLAADPQTTVVVSTLLPMFATVAYDTYEVVFNDIAPMGYQNENDRICAVLHALLDWFVAHCACGQTISPSMQTMLAEHLATFSGLYQALRPCPCSSPRPCSEENDSCRTTDLPLATGVADWIVTASQNGGTVPRPANVITAISNPYPGTQWISGINTYDNNVVGWTYFRRYFCLDRDSRVRIDLTFVADDHAEVYLDSELLGQSTLPSSGQIGADRYLTGGRHYVEIRVQNNPAYNSGLNATGGLHDPLKALLLDECCDNDGTQAPSGNEGSLSEVGLAFVNDICCGAGVECDRLRMLPLYAQLFCCRAQASTTALDAWLAEAEMILPRIMFDLGLDPNTMLPLSYERCDRIRHLFRVWLVAFAQPWRVRPLLRYKLNCLYDKLQDVAAGYAIAIADLPYLCDPYAVPCGRWIDMLACLCKLCGKGLVTDNSPMAEQINLLGMFLYTLPAEGLDFQYAGEVATKCEMVVWMLRYFALRCLDCRPITVAYPTLDTMYAPFHAALIALKGALGTQSAVCDDTSCAAWIPMLECLAKLGLRKNDLPQVLRDALNVNFTSLINNLYTAVQLGGGLVYPLPSPNPASATLDNLTWKSLELARAFYWLGSPYFHWSASFQGSLQGLLPSFQSAYASLTALASKQGVYVCQETDDMCGIQSEIASLHNRICVTAPDIAAAPITAINSLLNGFAQELVLIKQQLQIPTAAPPMSTAFCTRLAHTLQVVAAAYARFDELTASHRLMLRLFMSVLRYQAGHYWPPLAQEVLDTTSAGEFRAKWMELLDCLCRICRTGTTLPQNAQAAYTSITSGVGAAAIHALYADVLLHATELGMPVVNDPCAAGSVCAELRSIMAFFATFCFGCGATPDAAHTAAMSQLDTAHLGDMRVLLVTVRSILEVNQAGICAEESGRTISVQSTHLYLQAVGSDGSDGSTPGVHLRWELLNSLQSHMPKGNLAAPGATYSASYGANKVNDFVKISRTPYDQSKLYKLVLDLENTAPSSFSGERREWRYDNLVADAAFPAAKSSVVIRFEEAPYDARCVGCDPRTAFKSIIQGYTGVIEARVIEKTMFAVEITSSGASPTVQVEARSAITSADSVLPIISFRKSFSGVGPHLVMSEGMKVIRFRCQNGGPKVLRIQTYEDFHRATQKRYGWVELGNFSLSLDQTEVFKRLEDSANFVIDNAWSHFKDGTAGGAGKVKSANYRDRWLPGSDSACTHTIDIDPADHGFGDAVKSISGAVTKYLDLSRQPGGWEGTVRLYSRDHNVGENADHSAIDLSLLKMLKLVARDYHVARMLGLGYIDWRVGAAGQNRGQQYVYVAEYSTLGAGSSPDGKTIPNVVHRYLSLPTAPLDLRLPVEPMISDIQYGLPLVDGQIEPTTDTQGYAMHGDVRFVRINKHDAAFDQATSWTDSSNVEAGFFADTSFYSRGDNTAPIAFGVRHKMRSGSGTYGDWEKPEISNDLGEYERAGYEPYRDAGGMPETLAIPDKENPILVHRIIPRSDASPFWLRYGIYGINWFSRVSAVRMFTDEIFNRFPKRNTLIPPSRLTALFVQPETPRLFNSEFEQNTTALHDRSRLTFDWHHAHNTAYQPETAGAPIKLEFFFRSSMPMGVRGQIATVDESDPFATITVASYPDEFAEGGTATIVPHIDPSDAWRFINSMLVTAAHPFPIVSIDTTNPDAPIFTIRKVYEQSEDGGPAYLVGPISGENFLVVENLATSTTWQSISGGTMPVAQLSPHTETEVMEDGTSVTRTIGGIFKVATITEEWERQGPGPNYGQPIPGRPSGVYKITFAAQVLPNYASIVNPADIGAAVERVEWYRGVVRIAEDNPTGRMKALDVIRIETSSDPITISSPTTVYVYDPDYLNADHLIMPRAIGASRSAQVNFHPGYRVYLNLPTAGIAISSIMPQGTETSRETFVAVRAFDTSTPSASTPTRNYSSLTPPTVHLARQVLTPQMPETPQGPTFATRPDVYGKSTYTFDLNVKVTTHQPARIPAVPPYGMMFYRADDTAVLRALYSDATIEAIEAALPPRATDAAFDDRWSGLVNADIDNAGHFKAYGMDSQYHFPDPDRTSFSYVEVDGNGDPQTIHPFPWTGVVDVTRRKDEVRRAINSMFLPLTEQPVMFAFVKDDTNELDASKRLQTSPKFPSIRDHHGRIYQPGDPLFDPFPMVKRIASGGDWMMRFTDYTLDGASKNFFFYYAAELSNTMDVGPGSTVIGPVRLVNTMPPRAPEVLRVNARVAIPALNLGPRVEFTVASYAEAEGITKLRIYRTTDVHAAGSVRSMTQLIPDINVPADGIITDAFTDAPAQFGVLIYYRVVTLRPIINEVGATEYVASQPSRPMMVSLIDVQNPVAPELSATLASNGTVDTLPDITLHWDKTVEKGTYYLYKMTPSGTWKLIHKVDRTSAASMTYPENGDFTMQPETHALLRKNNAGSTVYYRFKVIAENVSGLLSTEERILTISE
ncbi:MAG: hypothetical protein JWQ98_1279 [Chlorobi bacterium]|nr:hypothetical protein [Chlorobiota bacterium]